MVLERIVIEGGDDFQLEPGEIVELVRRENNSTLCVRTLETANAPPMEGNVPASFLRRKCTTGQSEGVFSKRRNLVNQYYPYVQTVLYFKTLFNSKHFVLH